MIFLKGLRRRDILSVFLFHGSLEMANTRLAEYLDPFCKNQVYSDGKSVGTLSIRLLHEAVASPLISASGTFKGYLFLDFSEAPSRLYRRRFLQLKGHFAEFVKFYKIY